MNVTVEIGEWGQIDLTPYSGQIIDSLTIDLSSYSEKLSIRLLKLVMDACRDSGLSEDQIADIFNRAFGEEVDTEREPL